MKVSYRDKFLLIIFIALIVLGIGYLLIIKPKMNDISQSKSQVSALETKKADIEKQIEDNKNIDDIIMKAYSDAKDTSNLFFDYMTSYKIDYFIQEKLNKNNITCKVLNMEQIEEVPLTTYISPLEQREYPFFFSEVEYWNEEKIAEGELETIQIGASAITIEFAVAETEQIEKFLDDIKNSKIDNIDKKSLVVKSITYEIKENEQNEGSNGYAEESTTPEVVTTAEGIYYEGTIELNMYFMEPMPEPEL